MGHGDRAERRDGASLGVILFFEDVTFLMRVERMEAWREVARRIAHEIKNPLTPIQLSAQRLRKHYGAELSEATTPPCSTSARARSSARSSS